MKTVNTKDLIGGALNWAVGTLEVEAGRYSAVRISGLHGTLHAPGQHPFVSVLRGSWHAAGFTDQWELAGPIIERAKLELMHRNRWQDQLPVWQVGGNYDLEGSGTGASFCGNCMEHESLLVAAMRCYVKQMRGDTIEVPEVLL